MNKTKLLASVVAGTTSIALGTICTEAAQAVTLDFNDYFIDANGDTFYDAGIDYTGSLTEGNLQVDIGNNLEVLNGNAIYNRHQSLNTIDPFSAHGLTISGRRNGSLTARHLTLFDSNCTDGCSGNDTDLETGSDFGTVAQGNVLIFQDNKKIDNTYHNLAVPDDEGDRKPKDFVFDFSDANGVKFDGIGLLDFDDGDLNQVWFSFAFAGGGSAFINAQQLDDAGGMLLTGPSGNNSLREFSFNNDYLGLNTSDIAAGNSIDNVTKLEVTIPGSGAITYLEYKRENELSGGQPAEIPEPSIAIGLLACSAFASKLRKLQEDLS